MNAIEDNAFIDSLNELGQSLEKPKAIFVVYAHWLSPYNTISVYDEEEELIYDMYGFSDPLIQAAEIRFRPILMTGFTTIAGAIPLVISSAAVADKLVKEEAEQEKTENVKL